MSLQINLDLSPLQKKALQWGTIIITLFGGGFFTGVKTFSFKLQAQVGKYQIEIDKLAKNVSDRDLLIKNALADRDALSNQALIAKKQADDAGILADAAEVKYRALVKGYEPTVTGMAMSSATPTAPLTVQEVVTEADDVITKKNVEIKGLKLGLSDCFSAKAAADTAIKELQANRKDEDAQLAFKDKINIDLNRELESQKRLKWLGLIGGVLLGYEAEKHIIKK